jgi:Uma2 family endonuclease
MTPEEFDALEPEDFVDHYRYELIRGVLVVTPHAGTAERDPNEELGYLLRRYRDDHPQGSALDQTLPEQTIPTTLNRRRADRAIWVGLGRIPDEEKDIPAIVVEFVSASRRDHRRDYEEKLQEYLAAGVREYWIIDRFRRIMTVNRNSPRESSPPSSGRRSPTKPTCSRVSSCPSPGCWLRPTSGPGNVAPGPPPEDPTDGEDPPRL